jgi:DNA invertase Pin-like site-specific DNA recombinase
MTRPALRCAIYTRVSSDQGLEQDFNSLHAQREAAEAYIKSQAHEGWKLRRDRYDDGGFSGGSMDRPALKRLLADVAEKRVDIIVVYKVDRLTRSLADFAKLVELFDAQGVSFVSVTQSFNTTSSMGRLTLNVLLSFAQFEREVTGERIRDKIAASKKKGIWMGGVVPLGYRVADRKLLVEETEAATVRLIFERYLALGSIPALQRELRDRGIRSRPRVLSSGRTIGNVPLTNGPLGYLLRNRLYLGEINHKGASYPSDHPPLISVDLFDSVQAKLAQNLNRSDLRKSSTNALLAGRIFDDRGNRMSPSHAVKKGIRYRYYTSTAVTQGRKADAGAIRRVSAPDIERLVVDAIGGLCPHQSGGPRCDDRGLIEQLDVRLTVRATEITVDWRSSERLAPLEDDDVSDRRTLSIPYAPQPHRRRREIILPAHAESYVRPLRDSEHRHLLRAIAQGQAWLHEIVKGAGITPTTIAIREEQTERWVRKTLSLALLDPKLVRAAILGQLPRGFGAKRLSDLPGLWPDQWRALGLTRPA